MLRAYQDQVIRELQDAVAAGYKRILLVAPTGSGKTVIAGSLIKATGRDYGHSLFIAHRRELIEQTSRRLRVEGIAASVILAGRDGQYDAMARTQVAGIQSLAARLRSRRVISPVVDLFIIDEAHHARADSYQRLVKDYPDAIIVGLTATPCRGDGRGLGNLFEVMVQCPPVRELIRQGHLVPTVSYTHPAPDLRGVKTSIGGDWQEGDLAKRMNTDKLVGDIVTHWHRLGESRKTVVFATNVAHSTHIAAEFNAAGIPAGHIDGSTPIAEREETLRRLSAGELRVVSNCMVLTEGWDQPDVSCGILARPTKSLGLHLQMVGRVLRPANGKTDALILDHAGNLLRHGLAEDEIVWTLNADDRAENASLKARKKSEARGEPTMCPVCKPREVPIVFGCCSVCGWKAKRRAEAVEFEDANLARIGPSGTQGNRQTPANKERFFGELLWHAGERGYKPGWAAHKFKEKFGHWPPFENPPPVMPSPETLGWLRSRAIAYAKSRAA